MNRFRTVHAPMTEAQALKLAAADIWLSMRRFGHPDRVQFVCFV